MGPLTHHWNVCVVSVLYIFTICCTVPVPLKHNQKGHAQSTRDGNCNTKLSSSLSVSNWAHDCFRATKLPSLPDCIQTVFMLSRSIRIYLFSLGLPQCLLFLLGLIERLYSWWVYIYQNVSLLCWVWHNVFYSCWVVLDVFILCLKGKHGSTRLYFCLLGQAACLSSSPAYQVAFILAGSTKMSELTLSRSTTV